MAELYQPTLVIGLGGTGKKIILALKKMIAENSEHGMEDYPFLRFLSIDTDEAAPRTTSAIQTIGELSLNAAKEVYPLKAPSSASTPNLADYPQIKEWFPKSLSPNLMPASLSKGAGQKKPIGRFTFAWHAKGIHDKIYEFLSAPVDLTTALDKDVGGKISSTTNVFICSSVCGGTGAGTFLDTAYLVRFIAQELAGANKQIRIFGIMATSTLFDSIAGGSMIKPNCYASLVELDHFMNPINNTNEYRLFHPAYNHYEPNYSNSSKNQGPFDYPFLFDKTGTKGISLPSPEAFSEMAARFIYLLTGHEVSQDWFSMDNNVYANLENNYNNKNNKPIDYRSMGTFSILFPKRMVVQLCAHKLAQEYFLKILDDSYAPQEISNLATRFLADIKLNPKTEQIENVFDNFHDNDFAGKFADYLQNQVALKESEDIQKKDLVANIRLWKEDIDKKINEFRQFNATTAREIRKTFLSQLEERLSAIVDLHEKKDDANKTANGDAKFSRGSVVRAEKFVEDLIRMFDEANEKYRKKEDDTLSQISVLNSDFETALSDLDEAVDKIIAGKKKLSEAKENALNICLDLFNCKRLNLICGWVRQLFTDILENGIPRYNGIIKELETYKKNYQKAINIFNDNNTAIEKFLKANKIFEPNPLSEIVFDFKRDVEGTYIKLLAEKTEDFIFGDISDKLKASSKIGNYYGEVSNYTQEIIKIEILRICEKYFFATVSEINISELLLDNAETRSKLEHGTYLDTTSGIYLGVDNLEMAKVDLNFDDSTFFAITIPDEYVGKPCAGIKGVVKSNAGTRQICPMEADMEKFRDEPCPMFNRCLKQILLRNAPSNLSITPTSEKSEINIMHTIAGFPLSAVPSVMNSCKPEYESIVKKLKKKNPDDEELHMFGPMRFDDLAERTEDPKEKLEDFREKLLVAYVANRLKVQRLSVDFVTKKDLEKAKLTHDEATPSLHLGDSMTEAEHNFESTRIEKIKATEQFTSETQKIIEEITSNETTKKKFAEKISSDYEKLFKEMPKGFLDSDLDLLDKIAEKYCQTNLKPKIEIDSTLNF